MDAEFLIKALSAAEKGRSYAMATVVDSTVKGTPRKAGAKMIVLEDGTFWGTIGGGRNEKAVQKECLKAIKSGKPKLLTYNYFGEGQSVCGGQIKVFIEPLKGTNNLVICGAGHIALPLSIIGKMLNFKVMIVDNRKELANPKRFPHVDQIVVGNHAQKLDKLAIDKNTYIMIVTQGNEFDFECLKVAVAKEAAYLGVISSRAKRIKFFAQLKKIGVPQSRLNKVRIPAGVDIGAQTPEEIAISIAAEIIAFKNAGFIGTDKFNPNFARPATTVTSRRAKFAPAIQRIARAAREKSL